MARTQWYAKFVTLKSGTNPIYFSSDNLGIGADEYVVLDTKGFTRTDQRLEPLEGSTTFAGAFFSAIDPKKAGTASDITTVSELLSTYSSYVYKTKVEIYEGNSGIAYSSFALKFSGYIEERTRETGKWVFELSSLYKRAENPIIFPTGSCTIDAAFNYDATGNGTSNLVKLKDGVNVTVSRTYIFQNDGTSTTWTSPADSGTITFNTPTGGMTGDGVNVCSTHKDISIGTGASDIKLGTCYTFYARLKGRGAGGPDSDSTSPSTLTLTIAARDASGNTIESVSSPTQAQSASASAYRYVGVMFLVADPRTDNVRLTISIDDTGGHAGVIDSISFGTSNAWLFGREIVDILDYRQTDADRTASPATIGRASLCARGGLGSLASAHLQDEECIKITPIGGHPLDIARRLLLTTTTAGTNGAYDPGDGFGLGAEFSSSDLSSNIDTVRNTIITGTLYPAYGGGTTYHYGDIVSYTSKNWIAVDTSTGGFSGHAPAEGAYWTECGNPFNGENFKNYKMFFLQSEKIENVWEFIQTELMKPIHGNLFQNESGVLDARVWNAAPVVGSGTLTDDHRKFDGEIPLVNTRSMAVTAVVYRMDFDPIGTLDIQGNQDGSTSTFAREFVFDEKSYGDDNYLYKTQMGYREFVIESKGARGSHSARFGWCKNMNGDQMSYEVGRRIITRYRIAIDEYEWQATWSKRDINSGDIVSVTHPNMLNVSAGTWGRSAATMTVIAKELDYETGSPKLTLRADCDCPAITNTSGDAGATANSSVPTVSGGGSIITASYPQALTDDKYETLPVYPKDYARIIFIKLTGAQSDDLMVYAYSADSSSTPNLDKYQHVGDIKAGETVFYFFVIAATSGTISYFVKLRDRNSDRVYSAFSSTIGPNTAGNAVNYASRGPKAEIRQVSASGERGAWTVGGGGSGSFTSYGR